MEFVDLSRANKMFLLLLFLQIWGAGLTLGFIMLKGLSGLDPFAFTLFLIVLIGSVVTFFAIFNDYPPFHLLIYPAAISNLIISLFGTIDYINLVISVLLLYFQIRFPIEVKERSYRSPRVTERRVRKTRKPKSRK